MAAGCWFVGPEDFRVQPGGCLYVRFCQGYDDRVGIVAFGMPAFLPGRYPSLIGMRVCHNFKSCFTSDQ